MTKWRDIEIVDVVIPGPPEVTAGWPCTMVEQRRKDFPGLSRTSLHVIVAERPATIERVEDDGHRLIVRLEGHATGEKPYMLGFRWHFGEWAPDGWLSLGRTHCLVVGERRMYNDERLGPMLHMAEDIPRVDVFDSAEVNVEIGVDVAEHDDAAQQTVTIGGITVPLGTKPIDPDAIIDMILATPEGQRIGELVHLESASLNTVRVTPKTPTWESIKAASEAALLWGAKD